MDIAEDMYREEVLAHYRNPQNYGKIEGADAKYHDFNPVCGDEVTVYLKIGDGKITKVKFEGKGCAISQAAASIVTEEVTGKKLDYAKQIKQEQLLEMLPIKVSHLRIKCAMLAIKAIQKGIVKYEGKRIGK